jgi:thiamine biosynthesis protein ThiS
MRMDVLTETLTLTVNGEARIFIGALSVAGLVASLGLDTRKVAVELNREIVPRSTYAAVALQDGDVLEIVHFIGGG